MISMILMLPPPHVFTYHIIAVHRMIRNENPLVDSLKLIHWSWCVGVYRFHFKTAGWLVVYLPLWKILVKWDYCSKYYIYMGEKCSKPPTSWWIIGWSLLKQRGESSLPSGITHEMSNPGFMTIRDWTFEKSPQWLGNLLLKYTLR